MTSAPFRFIGIVIKVTRFQDGETLKERHASVMLEKNLCVKVMFNYSMLSQDWDSVFSRKKSCQKGVKPREKKAWYGFTESTERVTKP